MSRLPEVLRRAERQLWDGRGDRYADNKKEFSCDAVFAACLDLGVSYVHDVVPVLRSAGVPVGSLCAFDEFAEGPQRQAVRRAWLLFAADAAEELGL